MKALPPSPSMLAPSTGQDRPPLPQRRASSFAHHVDGHREASHGGPEGKRSSPTQLSSKISEPAVETVAPLVRKGADAAVLYPQSLRVIGYLSMLAHDEFGARPAPPFQNAVAVADAIPVARPTQSGCPIPTGTVSDQPEATSVLSIEGVDPGVRTASQDEPSLTAVADPYGTGMRRFARRFVRLTGDRLLLRDFSLNAERAYAVLEAFRSMTAAEGRSLNSATINGVRYERPAYGANLTTIRMDDHVG